MTHPRMANLPVSWPVMEQVSTTWSHHRTKYSVFCIFLQGGSLAFNIKAPYECLQREDARTLVNITRQEMVASPFLGPQVHPVAFGLGADKPYPRLGSQQC